MTDSTYWWKLAGKTTGALVVLFLIMPIVAIIPLSFNTSSILAYPLEGFSLKWYVKFIAEPRWWTAIQNSLVVGIATVCIATPLGTLAALGLSISGFRGKSVLIASFMCPMVVPTVVTAVGIYFLFSKLGFANSLTRLVLAHTALAVPFMVITVSAALSQLDRVLWRAAAQSRRRRMEHLPVRDDAADHAGDCFRRDLRLHDHIRRGGCRHPADRSRAAHPAARIAQRHTGEPRPYGDGRSNPADHAVDHSASDLHRLQHRSNLRVDKGR